MLNKFKKNSKTKDKTTIRPRLLTSRASGCEAEPESRVPVQQ